MDNIDQIRDELRSLPAYRNRLSGILSCIQKGESETASLLHSYEQERRDVEKMQQESFSAFALRLFGKYEDRLEKEQQEELAAKVAYDEAVMNLEELRHEEQEIRKHIAVLEQKSQEYEAELEARKADLRRRLSEPDGQRYRELDEERQMLCNQITEINEAARVASRASSTAQEALESLRKAENWATYDIFAKGGIISHAAKYSHVDAAQSNFHRLRSLMTELKRELADVQGLQSPQLNEVSGGQRIVDFWFDNIFTDISVRSQIKDNSAQIQQMMSGINRVQSALSSKLRELNSHMEQNSKQEEDLLLRMK